MREHCTRGGLIVTVSSAQVSVGSSVVASSYLAHVWNVVTIKYTDLSQSIDVDLLRYDLYILLSRIQLAPAS